MRAALNSLSIAGHYYHFEIIIVDFFSLFLCLCAYIFLAHRTVESEDKAEWGGEVEIRAMSARLGRRIFVYDAEAPLLRMGEDSPEAMARPPLRLAYHRHYFALGEHYNSVCALGKAASTTAAEAEEI